MILDKLVCPHCGASNFEILYSTTQETPTITSNSITVTTTSVATVKMTETAHCVCNECEEEFLIIDDGGQVSVVPADNPEPTLKDVLKAVEAMKVEIEHIKNKVDSLNNWSDWYKQYPVTYTTNTPNTINWNKTTCVLDNNKGEKNE